MNVQRVPVARIKTHPDLQMRTGGVLQARVEYYAEMSRDGLEPPPLRVVLDADTEDYWLWDGHYRLLAAKLLGLDSVSAEVVPGGFEHALWLAAGANASHGLERDADTVQRACETALLIHEEWSDRKLAGHVGCSASTVRRARERLVREGRLDGLPDRVGKDGRTRQLPASEPAPQSDGERAEESVPEHVLRNLEASLRRRSSASDEALGEWHGVDAAIVAEVRERMAREEEEASRGPDGVDDDPDEGGDPDGPDDAFGQGGASGESRQLCSAGLPIPDWLVDTWNEVWGRGDALLLAIKEVALLVTEVAQMPGGEAYAYALEHREGGRDGGAVLVKYTSPHLKAAASTVLGNLPHASACPECVRARNCRSAKGCNYCRGLGWLPKSVWENFPLHRREEACEWVRNREKAGD